MKKLIIITALFLVFTGLATSLTAHAAAPLEGACDTLTTAQKKDSTTCSVDKTKNPIAGTDGVINKIAQGVALVAGSVAVIVIIVSGITMVTSSGDPQSFKTARNAVIYASVGLVVILVAQALVSLVLNGV